MLVNYIAIGIHYQRGYARFPSIGNMSSDPFVICVEEWHPTPVLILHADLEVVAHDLILPARGDS